MTNDTISYYNNNALSFVENTKLVQMDTAWERFTRLLKPGDYILDFGCGSGRDTKFFLEHGYKVDAIDGSIELCRIASDFTGIKVRNEVFTDLSEVEKYDGVWACSSILHLNYDDLCVVIRKIHSALKNNGIFYTSFKYGSFSGERNGRYFTDFTEENFKSFLEGIGGFDIVELWITNDVRKGRSSERWLNLIMQKK